MARINLLWTTGRDVCYPTDEPNSTRGKARLDFFKLACEPKNVLPFLLNEMIIQSRRGRTLLKLK